ncbi:MAG TPA: sigma-54-dependent Fis family transcriptional regulator [Clostridia bacterium]|nr:sigma-54-dependent Fis family transcriptional regulator [Clostridia bacterium]
MKNYSMENLEMVSPILDSIHNAIIAIDLNDKIIIFNDYCEKFFGISRESILNKNIRELIPDSKLPQVLSTRQELIGEEFSIDEKVIFTNRTLLKNKDNEVIGVIALFSDVEEIQKVRDNLKEVEENLEVLETVLDSGYEGIIIVDENGYITKFNKAYQEFLNLKPEEVLGKHVTDVIENTRMHIVLKTGKTEKGHVQNIQGHDMIATRIPIKKDGKIIGAIGKVLFQDVKELESLAKRMSQTKEHLNYYKSEIKKLQEAKYSFDNIITKNPQIKQLKKIGLQAANSFSTVLIIGESGTGKELFAHAIHKASSRKFGAFIRINCSAIPKNLLESELFGYEKGAFTGANDSGKPGKFEMANGGSIFLDEIGTMPLEMQAKMLRVIQEKEVVRVGGNRTIDLDIRIIAATNENLLKLVEKGKFREDLYYRLNVINIDIPPLRKRKEDIPVLAKHLLDDFTNEMQLPGMTFHQKTLEIMKGYSWPGNVRELRNCVERSIHLSPTNEIKPLSLPETVNSTGEKVFEETYALEEVVSKAEYNAILEVLKKTNGNKTEAAEILGIHRTSLYYKINKYDIRFEPSSK